MLDLKTQQLGFPLAPVWDDNTRSVYFTDYFGGDPNPAFFRYSYDDGKLYSAFIPGVGSISHVYPVRQKCKKCKDIFEIAYEHGGTYMKWDGKSPQAQLVGPGKFYNVEESDTQSVMDVAHADRRGRLYFGTCSFDLCNTPANKSVYRYTNDRGVDWMFGGLYGTSGIVINKKAKKLYHSDYCSLMITEYDYDPITGNLSE